MAMTDAQICNLALGRVGHKQFIASLDEDSQAAECCSVVYQPCLLELLETSDWGFARKHAVLALVSGVTRSGWTLAYALPTDCLVVRGLFSGVRDGASLGLTTMGMALTAGLSPAVALGAVPKVPFDIESAADGATRLLLTDMATAEVLYTASSVTPSVFSQGFIQALAWRVAAEVALSLPVKRDLHQNAVAQAERALLRAKAHDLRERREDAQPESQFIIARY
jgi:hypothetical protein